jgi:hypothetical protein
MGIDDDVVEYLFLLDIHNEDWPKGSNEKDELVRISISPLVTSWVHVFPR